MTGPAGGPPFVRAAEQFAGRLSERRLAELTQALSARYRAPQAAGAGGHGLSADEVAAYCAFRAPATYAAARSALGALAASCPGWAPAAVVDLGGGTGAAAAAACAVFPSVDRVTVVDASSAMLRAGEEIAGLAAGALPAATTWSCGRLPPTSPVPRGTDLVILSYVLGEVAEGDRDALVAAAAAAAAGDDEATVLVLEPGTPAGHARVLRARQQLIDRGCRVAAPCPHDAACPMPQADWCHFAARVPRSHLHRVAKGAVLGYEDEKYSFVAATRQAVVRPAARIVRHPTWRRGLAVLQLCEVPPALSSRAVAKSAGALYRAARSASWGDGWPPAPPAV